MDHLVHVLLKKKETYRAHQKLCLLPAFYLTSNRNICPAVVCMVVEGYCKISRTPGSWFEERKSAACTGKLLIIFISHGETDDTL